MNGHPGTDRPSDRRPIDAGLPDERTALAWERTAVSAMVVGMLIARIGAQSLHWTFGLLGLVAVVLGSVLLVWSGKRYDELSQTSASGASPVHPTAARLVGVGTLVMIAVAFCLAVTIAIES